MWVTVGSEPKLQARGDCVENLTVENGIDAMHHVDIAKHLRDMSGFLGGYYLAMAMMNATAALFLWRSGREKKICSCCGLAFTTAHVWLLAAMVLTIMSPLAWSGNPGLMKLVSLPPFLFDLLNWVTKSPVYYTVGIFAGLVVLYLGRKFFVKPTVAWTGLNLTLLLMGLAMTDPNFAKIVAKPDNVPIVGLVYLLGFFTWLGAYKAVQNDERRKQGLDPLEKADDEKILVWPDLVYTELICMIALTALLLVWAIVLKAPLEEPASAVKTPNPSKAPWYFLGLQEMLVYYDPWMAGVVLPSLVIVGLAAIPYLDFNKEGNGYYTIDQRKFAYLTFQFGFLFLWVTLIVMGTFLRGPNWNIFGIFEPWDTHKVEALTNVDLSYYFWVGMLDQPLPKAPDGANAPVQFLYILLRESPGIVLTLGYFLVMPPALVIGTKYFRKMFVKMGFIRYMVMINLLLIMGLLPIKMVARWTVNMKYFIAIPEYFLNF